MEPMSIFNMQSNAIRDSALEELSGILEAHDDSGRGIYPESLGEILREAEKLLCTSCVGRHGDPLKWFCVNSIGYPAWLEGNALEEYFSRTVSELSTMLAGTSKSFGVRYSSWPSSSFSIGISEGGQNFAEAVLRATFGFAEVESTPYDVSDMTLKSEAECGIIFMDSNGDEQKFPREKAVNWSDRIPQAIPGRKYSAEIRFDPAEEKYLREKLNEIARLCGRIESYRQTSLQVSANIGNSYTETGILPGEMLKKAMGSVQDTPNFSTGASYSRDIHRMDAEYISDRLKFCYARIHQMLRGGAHSVKVSVTAENESDIHAVEAILSGTMATNGISLRWSRGITENYGGLILPDHALNLMFSVPSRDFPGFHVRKLEEYDISIQHEGDSLDFGRALWNGQILPDIFTIPMKEINRHIFVCGMTGSGKTNSVCRILSELDRPFLVIEPVKGEYRSLRDELGRNTEVYTMDVGSDEVRSVNPLWFPAGGSLQYHIDSIKTVIASAFELYAAMPSVLEQCLISAYIHSGWNIVTGRNLFEGKLPDEKLYPTISDLCAEIEDYLEKSDFQGEAKGNYKGALLSRLQSFTTGAKGILLNQKAHIDFDRIIKDGANIIIELDAVADDADKSIIMGAILAQYFQCVKILGSDSPGNLRRVTVLEEAHHLFAGTDSGGEGSEAKRKLSESLCNLLAEIRAYGEGIIIVDQSPSRISPEVIKNTALKIIHRLDYGEDLKLIRDTLLLREGDKTATSLMPGQALVRFGGMSRPAFVSVPLSESKENFRRIEKSSRRIMPENLVLSSADIIMNNSSFCSGLFEACRLFMNQSLFDGLAGIQTALAMLLKQAGKLIFLHGYDELAQASGRNELVKKIIIRGINSSLRGNYPGQKYLCETSEMFIERIVALGTSSDTIRPKEWQLLSDYRSKQLHTRIVRFYADTDDPAIRRLRTICGNSRYLGLASIIQPLAEKFASGGGDDMPGVLRKLMARLFFATPRQDVIDGIGALVKKYMEVRQRQ